ncbi:MAG: class I SAM-dependent methyltransferase [Chromatiaceae bacterium]|nr:MAG: class I SAM-dependent methyltransferase [Chromatiaceae bacterium]
MCAASLADSIERYAARRLCRRCWWAVCLAGLLVLGQGPCAGAPDGTPEWAPDGSGERVLGPEINAYYHGADVGRWRQTFESPGREVFDRRVEIVRALGLQPGMVVADVGAGTGLYSMLFAHAVGPTGRVYAVDISASFIEAISARAADYQVDNLVPVRNDPRSVQLPEASVDLIFSADTYHHFEFPRAMLASIHRVLRPNGVLALIDFHRIPGISSPWIMGHVRAGREQVIAEVEAAGFELWDEPLTLQSNYFLRFRKRLSASGTDGD